MTSFWTQKACQRFVDNLQRRRGLVNENYTARKLEKQSSNRYFSELRKHVGRLRSDVGSLKVSSVIYGVPSGPSKRLQRDHCGTGREKLEKQSPNRYFSGPWITSVALEVTSGPRSDLGRLGRACEVTLKRPLRARSQKSWKNKAQIDTFRSRTSQSLHSRSK